MVFIPVVPHRPAPLSPRARDLARRLKDEVEKFERQYPGTSREDLRAAAFSAIGDDSAGEGAAPAGHRRRGSRHHRRARRTRVS